MKITNQGLKQLTTEDEQKEIEVVAISKSSPFSAPNHNPSCTVKHPLLRFAFFQKLIAGKDKAGTFIWKEVPFWHVLNVGSSYHSTLSIGGLKEWGIINATTKGGSR